MLDAADPATMPSIDPEASTILAALARGEALEDATFDALYAPRWRTLSSTHWTPLEVAEIAVRWLTANGATRVLDVGAGVGKLCVYGALSTRGVHFVGVEQHAELVDEARRVAARLGVGDRVELRHQTIDTLDASQFDALYLYNPFAENLAAEADDELERGDELALGRERFARDVGRVEEWLRDAAVGTRLVTFHGFGGWIPDSFRLVDSMPVGWSALRAWSKFRAGGALHTAHAESMRR
jgi:SAM-dependent methyltransferase